MQYAFAERRHYREYKVETTPDFSDVREKVEALENNKSQQEKLLAYSQGTYTLELGAVRQQRRRRRLGELLHVDVVGPRRRWRRRLARGDCALAAHERLLALVQLAVPRNDLLRTRLRVPP